MESQSDWGSKYEDRLMLLIASGILGVVCVYVGMANLALVFGIIAGVNGGILMTREAPSTEAEAEEHF